MTLFRRSLCASPCCRVAVLGMVLWSLLVPSALGQTANPRETLYQRLGGYDGVASYVALVFPRVAQHPELAHMFRGHGKDSQQRQFQLVVELIAEDRRSLRVYRSTDDPGPQRAGHHRSELVDVHEDYLGRYEREEISSRRARRIPGDVALLSMMGWCRNDGRDRRPSPAGVRTGDRPSPQRRGCYLEELTVEAPTNEAVLERVPEAQGPRPIRRSDRRSRAG